MGEVASDTEPQTADPGKISLEINGSCEEPMDVSPVPSPTTSEVKENTDDAVKNHNANSIDSVESESNHSNSDSIQKVPNDNDVESMEEDTQENTKGDANIVEASENGENVENVDNVDEETSKTQEVPNEDGILIGDSSDEDDEEDVPAKTAMDNSDDEPMDVDGVQNGSNNDEPVSILSDSEPEEIADSVSKSNSVEEVKINGDTCSSPDVQEIESDKEDDCIVTNENTPKKEPSSTPPLLNESPRRSSRNINRKSYALDEDTNDEDDDDEDDEEESDIEEITPMDPLSDPLAGSSRPGPKSKMRMTITNNNTSITIPEPERPAEVIKPQPPPPKTGKKSPTLVIIDTNSILSGRGPIPMTSKNSNQNFSVMPVALPAQGVYPANMRATITPVPPPVTITRPAAPIILPSLTDDMFVVEAPSFIVPYVYEKPPIQPFKEFVDKLGKEIEELRLKEEKEKKEKDKEVGTDNAEKSGGEECKDEQKSDENESSKKKKKKRRKHGEDDESWDGSDHSSESDEDNSDEEETVKEKEIIVKEMKEDALDAIKEHIITPESAAAATLKQPEKKSDSYFENPLGKFFMSIGINLVQEHVQTDLLKQQKRKYDREGKGKNSDTQMAIKSLVKNLEFSKENNEPFRFEQKKCEFCNFKTESSLAMEHHMETPHMRNYVYRCNFCPFEIRSPHDILFHMEAEHNTRGRLERGPAYHQCPNCPFEDNGKGKLTRHLIACAKKYKPEVNLGPPSDWEPPAKIPRTSRPKQSLSAAANAFQAMQGARASNAASRAAAIQRARGNNNRQVLPKQTSVISQNIIRGGVMYRQTTGNNSVLVPTSYQYSGNQLIQVVGSSVAMLPSAVASGSGTVTIQTSSTTTKPGSKLVHQPSISITPLPRQPATTITPSSQSITPGLKPGQQPSGKTSFVICEICDGYIKDLDQLRNHMQWIHKVKIHPKMIYNRPPLNCQKCQFRFFTDQGLERHLLGSHGLVTSSMQEAANKGKDAGRCPVCGRVYQWKLLNHVARDHSMTLKPAHLSYKCTVCTATFGMYKQFENHVYSAHSVVAKKVMDKKPTPTTKTGGDSLLKPLKINDEITIIPQPPKPRPGPASRTASPAPARLPNKGK